jgi:hypothetical protein
VSFHRRSSGRLLILLTGVSSEAARLTADPKKSRVPIPDRIYQESVPKLHTSIQYKRLTGKVPILLPGVTGELIAKRDDIAAFPLVQSPGRPDVIDFSFSYNEDGLGILVKKEVSTSILFFSFLPFSLLFSSFVSFSLLFSLFGVFFFVFCDLCFLCLCVPRFCASASILSEQQAAFVSPLVS